MSKVIKLIDDETIEIIRYAKANACFHTNEYPIGETVCVFRETINPFQLYAELQRKDNIINEVKDIINRMIYMGYCAKTGKGTTATNFMAVGEQSEFGTRAKYILDRIKELEDSDKE